MFKICAETYDKEVWFSGKIPLMVGNLQRMLRKMLTVLKIVGKKN